MRRLSLGIHQHLQLGKRRIGTLVLSSRLSSLSGFAWRVLAALSSDDGQRQIDLAAMTSIDVSTLSRVVSRLVRMGLVTRTRSATNSREVVVRLSGKGAGLVARMIPRAIAAERSAIAGVPAKDLAVVRRSLRRMYENLAKPPSS